MSRPCVLVTDGDQRSAIAACRGLGAAGYDVAVLHSRRFPGARWSRFSSRAFEIADPVEEPSGFATRLQQLVENKRFDVLLAAGDPALTVIQRVRPALERSTQLGLPPDAAVARSLSKIALVEAATDVGLPPPTSVVCESVEAAKRAADGIGYAVVVKPSHSVVGSGDDLRYVSASLVERGEELTGAVERAGLPCVVQRFASKGSMYSFDGVALDDGQLLAASFARYHRTWRSPVGNTAYAQTLTPPPELETKVKALVAKLGWQGIFQVEFIGDGRRFETLDFNPRAYGCMALAIRAGANVPAVWCDWLLARKTPSVRARPNVYYRFEEADIRHLAWQLRRGRLSRAGAVMRPRRNTAHAFLEADDPGPAIAELLWITSRAGRRARLRLGRRGRSAD